MSKILNFCIITYMEKNGMLSYINNARVGVIGDFCVDIYWEIDMKKSELSLETPHFPHPVVGERIYPGAAGNVAVNVSRLKPKRILACGVVGNDWRAAALKAALERENINTEGFVTDEGLMTNAYCKPMLHGISSVVYEDPRIDFENFKSISDKTEEKLLLWLDSVSTELDVLCVCDQFRQGIITERVREKVCSLAKSGLTVIVDSRYRAGLFKNVIIKPNEKECFLAVYGKTTNEKIEKEDAVQNAKKLSKMTESKVLLTLGEEGSAFIDGESIAYCEAVKVSGELDVCGCGDAYLGAFASMIAGGSTVENAMKTGSAAAAFAIKSIGVTGNATRKDIEERL